VGVTEQPSSPAPWPPPPPAAGPGEPGPPPGTEPPVPVWNLGRLRVPEARASATSQVAVYVVTAFAFGLLGWATDGYHHAVAAMFALGVGALIGSTTEVDRAFRQASGVVLGILTTLTLTMASVIVSNALRLDVGGADVATQLLLGAGLLVAGLDWRRVGRLKAVPVLAGVPVVIVVAMGSGPVLALGVGWLALAVAALWSLEVDQRRAYEQPRALGPRGDTAPDDGARDLAGSLVLALLLGALLASFAAVPSCSPSLGSWNPPWQRGGGNVELPNGPDLLSFDTDLGSFGFRGPTGQQEIDIDGVPHRLVDGASGRPELENVQTGERLSLAIEGDDLVARDRNGTERARFAEIDQAKPDERDRGTDWRVVALVVVVAAAALGLLWWWLRRRRRGPPPDDHRSWAESRVRDLDRFSRAHGRPRAAGETVHRHTAHLVTSVAPDDRLHRVGDVLSDALFGRGEPTMADRLWTEQVIHEVTAAHPAPRWWQRRRRRPTATIDAPVVPG